jgi:hypothetical protein
MHALHFSMHALFIASIMHAFLLTKISDFRALFHALGSTLSYVVYYGPLMMMMMMMSHTTAVYIEYRYL